MRLIAALLLGGLLISGWPRDRTEVRPAADSAEDAEAGANAKGAAAVKGRGLLGHLSQRGPSSDEPGSTPPAGAPSLSTREDVLAPSPKAGKERDAQAPDDRRRSRLEERERVPTSVRSGGPSSFRPRRSVADEAGTEANLSVRVRDDADAPVPGAWVLVQREGATPEAPLNVRTDESGSAEIVGPPGTRAGIRIATVPAGLLRVEFSANGTPAADEARQVEFGEAGSNVRHVIHVQRTGGLRLTVLPRIASPNDPQGDPSGIGRDGGYSLQVFAGLQMPDGTTREWRLKGWHMDRGELAIDGLPPGVLTVWADAMGFGAGSAEVRIRPGEVLHDVLPLRRGLASLRIVLAGAVEEQGGPVVRIEPLAGPGDPAWALALTSDRFMQGSDGRECVYAGLPAGRVLVRALGVWMGTPAPGAVVVLRDNETSSIKLGGPPSLSGSGSMMGVTLTILAKSAYARSLAARPPDMFVCAPAGGSGCMLNVCAPGWVPLPRMQSELWISYGPANRNRDGRSYDVLTIDDRAPDVTIELPGFN